MNDPSNAKPLGLAPAVLLGALLGACLSGFEVLSVLRFGELEFSHVREQILGLMLRWAGLGAGLALVLGLVLRNGTRALSGCAGLLLLILLGDWLHEVWLGGVGLFAARSLAATAGLFVACAIAACAASRLRAAAAPVLLAVAAVCWIVAPHVAASPDAVESQPEVTLAPNVERPNIAMLVIDTLRADRLGSYGYERPTSPQLDALAARGARFDQPIAQAPWTRASVASLMTGLYPRAHAANSLWQPLVDEHLTLAEALAQAGYQTACFSANGNVAPVFGFDQGFERFWINHQSSLERMTAWGRLYDFTTETLGVGRQALALDTDDAEVVNLAANEWLDQLDPERPFFLYVQYIDPHSPYGPPVDLINAVTPDIEALYSQAVFPHNPAPFPFESWPTQPDGLIEGINDLYDAEIAYVDREVGKLVEQLEAEHGLFEDTYLVVTSDHGEEFLEHGHLGHGQSLFEELLRVPLIVAGPNIAPRVVAEPVELVDLYPTLLDWSGIELNRTLHGTSLTPLLAGVEPPADAQVVPGLAQRVQDDAPLTALRWGQEKLLRIEHDGRTLWRLFDLSSDPSEQADLSEVAPERLAALQLLLSQAEQRSTGGALAPAAEDVEVDAETRARLVELGYLRE